MKHVEEKKDPLPVASFGMPIRNGEDFLEESLQALLNQTYEDFELIISDNASEDKTASICRHYARRDRRIHYHRFETNVGAARNYNHVFQLARGQFFKWAAHDDICWPDFLAKCIEAFKQAPPSVVLVYPRTEFIDGEGRSLNTDTLFLGIHESSTHRRLSYFINNMHYANPLFGLIRSDVLRKTRLIDMFVKSDYVLLAELMMLGEFREVPEVLFQRRIHEKRSMSANKNKFELRRWFSPTKNHALDFLPVDLRIRLAYAASACRLPIPAPEKFRCLAVIASVRVVQELRNAGGLYKERLKELLYSPGSWKK